MRRTSPCTGQSTTGAGEALLGVWLGRHTLQGHRSSAGHTVCKSGCWPHGPKGSMPPYMHATDSRLACHVCAGILRADPGCALTKGAQGSRLDQVTSQPVCAQRACTSQECDAPHHIKWSSDMSNTAGMVHPAREGQNHSGLE